MKCFALFIMLLFAFSAESRAQIVRLNQQVKFRPQLAGGTIILSASPSNVAFTLVHGAAATGSAAISIQSTFTGLAAISGVSLYGYFTSTNALSDSAGDTLPSSDIFGICHTGTPLSYTSFTQAGPFASGSSLLIWQSSSQLSLGAGRTDVLSLKIDLTSTPELPAGHYSGTLNLQIQAF